MLFAILYRHINVPMAFKELSLPLVAIHMTSTVHIGMLHTYIVACVVHVCSGELSWLAIKYLILNGKFKSFYDVQVTLDFSSVQTLRIP